jgi:hypothetical protein
MTKTLRTLRIRNKGYAATRRAAKQDLERYKKQQKNRGIEVDEGVVMSYRHFAREDARYHHVAYSLLRGNKYSEVERSCREKLDPKKLLEVIQRHLPYFDRKSYDLDRVKELLAE